MVAFDVPGSMTREGPILMDPVLRALLAKLVPLDVRASVDPWGWEWRAWAPVPGLNADGEREVRLDLRFEWRTDMRAMGIKRAWLEHPESRDRLLEAELVEGAYRTVVNVDEPADDPRWPRRLA